MTGAVAAGFRLAVCVPVEVHEVVAELLRGACGGALEIVDAETMSSVSWRRPPSQDEVVLVAYPPAAEVTGTVMALRQLFEQLREQGVLTRPTRVELEEDDGEWRYTNEIVIAGGRFVVARPWLKPRDRREAIVLTLDPGEAFGDGRHPSTDLTLRALASLHDQREDIVGRVLDVGCGSGILSLAAAALWPAAHIVALDPDSVAAAVTVHNRRYAVAPERISVLRAEIDAVGGTFDLVCANLTAAILSRIAALLCARVAPGGHLVAAGFADGEASRVLALLERTGLRVAGTRSERGWVVAVLLRPVARTA